VPLSWSIHGTGRTRFRLLGPLDIGPSSGVVVALVALFPLHWLVILMHSFTRNEESLSFWRLPPATLERLGMTLVVPYTLITIGTRVVPAFRLYTAVALSILVLSLGPASQ